MVPNIFYVYCFIYNIYCVISNSATPCGLGGTSHAQAFFVGVRKCAHLRIFPSQILLVGRSPPPEVIPFGGEYYLAFFFAVFECCKMHCINVEHCQNPWWVHFLPQKCEIWYVPFRFQSEHCKHHVKCTNICCWPQET